MIEINLRNAFYVVVKLTWEYGVPKFNNVGDAAYKVTLNLIHKPKITTAIISFLMILGTTTLAFSAIILLCVLCLTLILIILEGLALLIIIIISCQGLIIIMLTYMCATIFLSLYKDMRSRAANL